MWCTWSTLLILGALNNADLERAAELYDRLEYEQVLPMLDRALDEPSLTLDEKLTAYRLKGSSLAVLGRIVDAENAFRLLLRVDDGFDLDDKKTAPKILTVFRKVQLEEQLLRQQLGALQREKIVAGISIAGELPNLVEGGRPLEFRIDVTDPGNDVATVQVLHRRQGEAAYSSVAAVHKDEGWTGAIGGDWTASPDGFTAEVYVALIDRRGTVLRTRYSPQAPHRVEITPGNVDTPVLEQAWFWTVTGTAVVAVGVAVAGGIALATAPPPSGLGVYRLPR